MTHEDAGHYAAKHPPGTRADEQIAEMIRNAAEGETVSCAAAHKIAADLGVSPAQVGMTIDVLEMRIGRCQLGLFGHTPESRTVTPADKVDDAIKDALTGALAGGRLSCRSAWDIAARFKVPRSTVASCCEALQIKVCSCQLGAFK